LRWTVSTGENISFWWDNRVDNSNLVEILGKDSSMLSNPECNDKIWDLTNPECNDKIWDLTKLHTTLNNDSIIQKILGIPIPIFEKKDTFYWGLTGSGFFNTRSASWVAHNSFNSKDAAWSFKWIWQLDIMPKIKIFLWQLLHNAVPVHGVLVRRGLNIDPAFSLCMNDIESNDHLFWECPCIKEVWNLAQHHRSLLLPEIHDGPRCSENNYSDVNRTAIKKMLSKLLIYYGTYEKNATHLSTGNLQAFEDSYLSETFLCGMENPDLYAG